MGAYLSQPNTVKTSFEGGNETLSYAVSAMQGWRVSMEDAHSCIPDLDEETALFAVYDGHGGEEVALYCAKYLPSIIKEQKAYKDGRLQKALEDAFLAIDAKLTTEPVIKELCQIAGRGQDDDDDERERVADEDDVDNEEATLLHEEARMTIEELLTRYGQNMNCAKNVKNKHVPVNSKKPPPGEMEPDKQKDINGEIDSCETDEHEESKNGKLEEDTIGISSSSHSAETGEGKGGCSAETEEGKGGCSAETLESKGGCSNSEKMEGSGNEEIVSSTGEAGPSCSLTAKPQPAVKSKFFEDSEDESEEAEDEDDENDSEECSEEEGECSSEETDEEEDDEDSEDAEEEEEEEEEEGGEMMLPGMDGKEEPGSDSGTTAVVALLCGTHLIVANAGDSRCVVAGGGKAVDMSYDHKPEDEVELNRIKNAGGKVTMDGRVNGGLNLSRAIGDHFYKRNKNLPPEEQMISALPDVKVLALKPEHEFMVIACDGIWNVMTSQEVIDFVQERINKEDENGELRSLTSIVEELLDQCLAPDTSGDGTGCDNMTCIIVTFQPRPLSSQQDCNKRKLEEDPVEDSGRNSGKKFKP